MVKITPVKTIKLAKVWRPWSSQIFYEVPLEDKFWDTTIIVLFVTLIGPIGLCIAVLVVMIIVTAVRDRRERRRDFRRSDEEGTPKSRASPPSRTTEMV